MFDPNDEYAKRCLQQASRGIWYTNDITTDGVTWTKVDDFLDNLAFVQWISTRITHRCFTLVPAKAF
ncbi:MAG: hypothetical protein R3C26_09510 [Calditrichia bacterium]